MLIWYSSQRKSVLQLAHTSHRIYSKYFKISMSKKKNQILIIDFWPMSLLGLKMTTQKRYLPVNYKICNIYKRHCKKDVNPFFEKSMHIISDIAKIGHFGLNLSENIVWFVKRSNCSFALKWRIHQCFHKFVDKKMVKEANWEQNNIKQACFSCLNNSLPWISWGSSTEKMFSTYKMIFWWHPIWAIFIFSVNCLCPCFS